MNARPTCQVPAVLVLFGQEQEHVLVVLVHKANCWAGLREQRGLQPS
jgi:hypothetical protein